MISLKRPNISSRSHPNPTAKLDVYPLFLAKPDVVKLRTLNALSVVTIEFLPSLPSSSKCIVLKHKWLQKKYYYDIKICKKTTCGHTPHTHGGGSYVPNCIADGKCSIRSHPVIP